MSQIIVHEPETLTPDDVWRALPDKCRRGNLGHKVSRELADIGDNPPALIRFMERMGHEVVTLREDVDDLQHRVSHLEGQSRFFPARQTGGGEMGAATALNLWATSLVLLVACILALAVQLARLRQVNTPYHEPVPEGSRAFDQGGQL